MLVAIDAGHGYYTAGKRCFKGYDVNETREWELNSRIANYTVDLLDKYGIEGLRLDDVTGKRDVPLKERVALAEKYKAKLYISIHHNADADIDDCDGINDTASGIVVFHYPKEERAKQAERLYELLIAETGLKGNRVSPIVQTTSLYVIRETTMPAFLIENGFMDSPDVSTILTDYHARATARCITQFCIEQLGTDKECKCKCGCKNCVGCVHK